MQNIQFHFSYPWLMLLLIPGVAFTLISYFRLAKRYRKTRNRITSIVLHILVLLFSITTLAGFTIRYTVPNEDNEIILLVDVSDTEELAQADRDAFIQTFLDDNQLKYNSYKVGVVTFGFDQNYAVPLTNEIDGIYDAYKAADLPDTSATNIASALKYAKTLFSDLETGTGKIVLVTDGKETDEEANAVIRSIVAQGTLSVDTAYVHSAYEGQDVQIVGITMPEYHVAVGDQCEISVSIQSKNEITVMTGLTDNGTLDMAQGIKQQTLIEGLNTVTFTHTFQEDGLHEIGAVLNLSEDEDLLMENNVYSTYHYLQVFNKLLIIERTDGESEELVSMLDSEDPKPYDIMVKNIADEMLPTTVDGLREYDQVILNNIANEDMPEGFDEVLQSYVQEYGGGLFTVGGNNEYGEANAYNRADMYGTTYQDMLPVEATNYTPPIAVMIIIDRSGSMGGSDDYGQTFLEGAKAGALACLDVLYAKDYIGIMTLDSDHSVILDVTPRTQETKIREAIASIETANGNTIFAGAIDRAGQALRGIDVAKRHIIVVSDGQVSDTSYDSIIEGYYNTDGITFSVVGVNMNANSQAAKDMKEAVDLGHGNLYVTRNTKELVTSMREDLVAPEIREVNEEEFKPIINDPTSSLVQNLEHGEGQERNRLTVELGGFYGVRIKENADLILIGDYEVPIYAQWKYGKGTVGSFMCDLQASSWSSSFMSDDNGKQFIYNVINNLMPMEDIRPNDISITLTEDNYTNTLSVRTELAEGQSVTGEIVRETDEGTVTIPLNTVTDLSEVDELPACYVTLALSKENGYSRCGFVAKESGIYKIVLKKIEDATGAVLEELVVYKSFAYSEEYDTFTEETAEDLQASLANLANRGNGTFVEDLEDPSSVFDTFLTDLEREFDPRILFMILALICFLLDVAVRKFKFKWPHEIVRDYKRKKESKKR